MTAEKRPLSIGIGAHVEVELIDQHGEREPMVFDIVASKYADLARGLLAATTPLAQALRGLRAGSEVPYVMGDIRSVRVISVSRAETGDLEEVREQREAVLRKALNAAQRTANKLTTGMYLVGTVCNFCADMTACACRSMLAIAVGCIGSSVHRLLW